MASDNRANMIKTANLILDHIQEDNLDDVDINDSNINGYVMSIQNNYIINNNNMNTDKKDIYSDAIYCYEYLLNGIDELLADFYGPSEPHVFGIFDSSLSDTADDLSANQSFPFQ